MFTKQTRFWNWDESYPETLDVYFYSEKVGDATLLERSADGSVIAEVNITPKFSCSWLGINRDSRYLDFNGPYISVLSMPSSK